MKLNKVEVREQYQLQISDRSAASENLDNSRVISGAWEIVKLLTFWLKRGNIGMNVSSRSCGIMKTAQHLYTKGSRLNYIGYRIQYKLVHRI
jgi:hypothetical protein